VRLAGGQRPQRRGQFRPVAGQHDGPVRAAPLPLPQRAGDPLERLTAGRPAQPVRQHPCLACDPLGGGVRERKQQGAERCRRGDLLRTARPGLVAGRGAVPGAILGRSGGHHDVHVGAAEPERGHPGGRPPRVVRPWRERRHHVQPEFRQRDVRARRGEVQRGRDLPVVHREHRFDQPGDPRRGLQVADVALHRADQRRPARRAGGAEDLAERACLDRVAERRAGAVCLDVVHLARTGVRGPEQVTLGGTVRRDQPVGPAVGVDRGAGDDGEHPVAVAHRVRQPLQHDHAAALAADHAVRGGVERAAPAVG